MRGKRSASGDVWCGYPHATKALGWAGPRRRRGRKGVGCVPYKNVLDK